MKRTWNFINGLNIKVETKNQLFITLMILINGAIGLAIWLIVGKLVLSQIEWMLCFVGYPAIFVGLFGGILYLYNHDFDEMVCK